MSRRILVTGSSRGIGKAIALQLAQAGFDVTVHARSRQQEAEQVVQEIQELGQASHALLFDVNDREKVLQLLEQDIAEHGAFYGVVLNAGLTRDAAFPALTDSDWDEVVSTSLDGFYNVLKPLVMPMIRLKQGGRIVTLSSVSGLMGNRGQVNYSAAKAGLIGATKALALELAKRKITVNCVAPGLIETEMVTEEVKEHALKMIPLQRMGQVDEVAKVVKFLCSDDASYITRQVISVNGGLI
ncbi:3-ketoacyl-ACP reductase FabG2 [Acinetobacter kookii]|uniref:3-oxoacyl-[acyl-carrier protein] reductase n=1 Tax=Acinetobacter kookii TaxID=1226327 RepID=A0A1G6N2N3_9GAMM|nr:MULTISPECIES: 3-ketoacyl-ACP reductase FabG2 [Acinetobacter]MCT8090178.1 3-oxoacyl-ACP reductase FabG [Acinetobacter sp. F_3_1]MCT8098654.1 3-oxoacyl-ACP reductase FabG [Acinetobacter sp. C_3_1]MCT8101726.1 3-oxoacyl-ACP reductase FabG [Acinetobacter sp. C_4_1]MCT8135548.1 3-oxoacyl-ACP reductase FabG [Acinetobacter sp. T_3_1]TCB68121.1 3-oxoacyl-ACP reductase FabG [Acinetobacter sp. ANC 4216]